MAETDSRTRAPAGPRRGRLVRHSDLRMIPQFFKAAGDHDIPGLNAFDGRHARVFHRRFLRGNTRPGDPAPYTSVEPSQSRHVFAPAVPETDCLIDAVLPSSFDPSAAMLPRLLTRAFDGERG